MSRIETQAVLRILAEKILSQREIVVSSLPFDMEFKSLNDVVTTIDIALEQICITEIRKLEPSAICVSEEAVSITESAEYWIIDPLDGTSNFVQGVNPSAISIAKISNGEVVVSMVIDLSNFDIYTAIKSQGSFLNFEPIEVKPARVRLLGVSTGFLKRNSAKFAGWNYRIFGSQALQLCAVATGSLAANISHEARAWDDAAGSLIVAESGGLYMKAGLRESWLSQAVLDRPLRSVAISAALEQDAKDQIIRAAGYDE